MAEPKFSNGQKVQVKTSGSGNPPSEEIQGKVVSVRFDGVMTTAKPELPMRTFVNYYLAEHSGQQYGVREGWLEAV